MKVYVLGRDIIGVFATRERAAQVSFRPDSDVTLEEMEVIGLVQAREDISPHRNLELPRNVNLISGSMLDDYAVEIDAPPRIAGENDQSYRRVVAARQRSLGEGV